MRDIELFNRSYRQRVLNAYLFNTLEDVREQTQIWVDDYNHHRPHDAFGGMSPVNYRKESNPLHGLHSASAAPSLHFAHVNRVTNETENKRKCLFLKCTQTGELTIKEAIEKSLTSTRSGRQKVIVKVQRKHLELGAYRIRRVYENEGFSLFKRMKNKRLKYTTTIALMKYKISKLQMNMLHNRHWVYLGMHLGKYMQKGRQSNLPPYYFRRNNLSLVGCSPAEPTSVLIEQGKIQSKLLYL